MYQAGREKVVIYHHPIAKIVGTYDNKIANYFGTNDNKIINPEINSSALNFRSNRPSINSIAIPALILKNAIQAKIRIFWLIRESNFLV